jgi:hypothetical protein
LDRSAYLPTGVNGSDREKKLLCIVGAFALAVLLIMMAYTGREMASSDIKKSRSTVSSTAAALSIPDLVHPEIRLLRVPTAVSGLMPSPIARHLGRRGISGLRLDHRQASASQRSLS